MTISKRSLRAGAPLLLLIAAAIAACEGEQGPAGAPGQTGAPGADGAKGEPGAQGEPGQPGSKGDMGPAGQKGDTGAQGEPGAQGDTGPKGDPGGIVTQATNAAELVKERVDQLATGKLPAGTVFPLPVAATDSVRTIAGLSANVLVRWLEPLTFDNSPTAPRFGANNDFIAYFGDNPAAGEPPQWGGSPGSAWMWVNHEYVSGAAPKTNAAPTGQHLIFAQWLVSIGVLAQDVTSSVWPQAAVDTYVRWYKTQVGGSWIHIVQDPSSGEWSLDRSATPVRYDATSKTLTRVSGQALSGVDQDDTTGAALPAGVVSGIMADCAGGVTPWGTVITAEENVQDFYGDIETGWSSSQQFVTGASWDPGANVSPTYSALSTSEFGRISDPNGKHARDAYGYLVEMDPGAPAAEYDGATAPGKGHKKLGYMGRARWEAMTFAVGMDWKLLPGEPLVGYGTDDRRGGRIYKWVSASPYTAGMTKAQTRALLDVGKLYVAHFAGLDNATGDTMLATASAPTEAAPGTGSWIELSVGSTDIAPNAAALGSATKTVGAALKDTSWNGLGGFPSDDMVRLALFTASAKIGAMELNRPEDIEYNPLDASGKPRIYVTFTNHTARTQLDQAGVLRPPATQPASAARADAVGSIFALEEMDTAHPGASKTFKFLQVWHGAKGKTTYDAANPDNLLLDKMGGVWFGTDGNFGTNGHSDALYFLDLDPAHKMGQPGVTTPTYGKAFRVIAMPSDAEATGPAFSSDMRSMFVSVQHPGEGVYSAWPDGEPRSSVIAVTFRP